VFTQKKRRITWKPSTSTTSYAANLHQAPQPESAEETERPHEKLLRRHRAAYIRFQSQNAVTMRLDSALTNSADPRGRGSGERTSTTSSVGVIVPCDLLLRGAGDGTQ
jgi:hypothetical protein